MKACIIIFLITIAIAAIGAYSFMQTPAATEPEAYHIHADIKIYAHDQLIDLSLPEYQSTEERELDPDTHLHDGNGNVWHIHAEGITLGRFVSSLPISLAEDENNKITLVVNGKKNLDAMNFTPEDLDRALLYHGAASDEEIMALFETVTDEACIYSHKCPERGTPPEEKCGGGIGSKCRAE
ncbi:hypothetical protein L0Y46_04570 [bacterium]|nr:hypothetical protein [bacterium]MCI0679813.1 hypothetical protein [bacterium]